MGKIDFYDEFWVDEEEGLPYGIRFGKREGHKW